MKVAKKIEHEVFKVYDTWLHSYLHGDVEIYDSFLDDDYHFIGSAMNEEFLNRRDTTQFFADTGDQFAGKTELRNEIKKIEQFGDLVFITHIFDGWFLNENNWTYYARFRFSSTLRKNKEGWRFIYQHFSIPDAKTDDGGTIGYDKINEENQELREAIQRRTVELESKNRELEVEGALQRIRAEAVAMKESTDLLDIVVTMRNEFTRLGHQAHYFWHMMWLKDTYEKAMTSGDGTRIGFVMKLPKHIHGDIPLLAKWEKSKKPTVVYAMNAKEAIAYVDKMINLGDFQNIDPQAPSHDDIRHIGGLTFIMARTSHGEIGYSLPGIVEKPPQADLEILEKFADAFDLAHRRFLDLQKAENQAREVQIELALEKVRSRTMAMQHSDELQETSFLLDEQVRALGIKTWGCAFNIYGENESTEWFGNEAGVLHTYTVPREGIFKEYYQKGQQGESVLIKEFSGAECIAHYEYMSTLPVIGDVLKTLKARNKGFPTYQIDHVVYFKYGYLLFITREPVSEAHEIFKRFAKVFEQTYTRFLDLQKAEAQAREAKIEAALERVRSRSMAMHNSEELKDVIHVLYDQFIQLNINIEHAGFILDYKKNDDMHIWLADHNAVFPKIVIPYFDCAHWNDFIKAKKTGQNFFANTLDFEEKNQFYTDLFKHIPGLPEETKATYFGFKGLAISTVLLDNVGLYIENYSGVRFSEDENAILMRFGKVFQQTYTRFLDLQKAEAQAREAQIENALEKVRSRTMAMQKSEELPQAANNLFFQVQDLGIPAWSAGYCIWTEDKKSSTAFMSSEGEIQTPFILPNIGVGYNFQKPFENGDTFHIEELGGQLIGKHYEFMRTLPTVGKMIDALIEAGLELPTFQIFHICYFKHGYVMFITYEKVPEAHEIFRRFANVFEQTYTRFLDLQKAEAQTREAKIEAALERTRTQSMLMQHSDELDATSKVFHEQLQLLGIDTEFSYVWLPDEDKNEHQFWVAWNTAQNKKKIKSKAIVYPLDKAEPYTAACFEDWISGIPVHIHHIKPEEVKTFFTAWEELLKDANNLNPEYFANGLYYAEAFMKYGCFGINIKRPISDEEKQILQRFSVEFERTYTRFLDLQKAEAQARESKIEAALEKVRSRSLAMHKPDELEQVVVVIVEKLKELGVVMDANGVILCTYFNNSKDVMHWIASPDFRFAGSYLLPYFNHPIFNEAWKSKESGADYFSKAFTVEQKNSFFKYAFEHSDYRDFPEDFKKWIFQNDKHTLSFAWQKNSAILIPSHTGIVPNQSEQEILKRFAKVFEQAYIRFMDLQKAEDQAREAKIEASLEKVRSVALSLQKSDDMLDIAKVLYEQLLELGFNDIRNAIIDIHNDDDETFLDYDYSHDMSSAITQFSYYGDAVIEKQIKQIQSSNDAFFEIELKGKELEELIETRLRNGEKDDPRLREIDHLTYNLYSFGNGAIGISNFGLLNEDQKKILKRFRNVFTFAYKRYTDLANAEAQAREAKIEASLEKVRSVALGMNESTDLLHIAKALYEQLEELGFNDIRNAIIDVNNEDNQTFLDYDYSHEMGGTITLMSYDDDPTLEEQLRVIAATTDGYSEMVLQGQQLQDLIEMRRKNGEADDPRLFKTDSISYILYAFGNGAVGISNFGELSKDQKNILDRFRNVFTFAYQRFTDLQVKEKQSSALLAEKQRLENTLSDLQATQKQLIQSEKMASLGELTAGIAHEIQNPLNFVNNFSEVSNELIDEMNEEIEKGELEEAKLIANDIKQNLEKISHHGKRADAIVKGMLQHSRKSTAEKEATDINKLADEYLRLAYHGLRAKDKSFNATLETDFDESIGKIKIIPQDMGRVILNLITNAFYACNEKKKTSKDSDFKPIVSVSTKKLKDQVVISVKDNGNGIPKQVMDKIFQPFFTTKPTGEGTGLGLSMSYDIVSKGHMGELKVATKKGLGTTFKIIIPK
ncbi:MAG: nuclear transport factor 2 family protein [Altibacter sp.]|uniref:ATP-binding protein n=1 Tax=Altibacter sp. TaxID=2024823 RepID=UPI001D562502|nr:ATP-binding protein [Altibacter sp.]MBZ0327940.1 nuclear transport factor 2 family protein [Altibacter sp.]